jgi:hypothetical protein
MPSLWVNLSGVDGLLRDKTRPSRIPRFGPEVAERVVALTLADPPTETTHWTADLMARARPGNPRRRDDRERGNQVFRQYVRCKTSDIFSQRGKSSASLLLNHFLQHALKTKERFLIHVKLIMDTRHCGANEIPAAFASSRRKRGQD